jgi:hypothetical protein
VVVKFDEGRKQTLGALGIVEVIGDPYQNSDNGTKFDWSQEKNEV